MGNRREPTVIGYKKHLEEVQRLEAIIAANGKTSGTGERPLAQKFDTEPTAFEQYKMDAEKTIHGLSQEIKVYNNTLQSHEKTVAKMEREMESANETIALRVKEVTACHSRINYLESRKWYHLLLNIK